MIKYCISIAAYWLQQHTLCLHPMLKQEEEITHFCPKLLPVKKPWIHFLQVLWATQLLLLLPEVPAVTLSWIQQSCPISQQMLGPPVNSIQICKFSAFLSSPLEGVKVQTSTATWSSLYLPAAAAAAAFMNLLDDWLWVGATKEVLCYSNRKLLVLYSECQKIISDAKSKMLYLYPQSYPRLQHLNSFSDF